MEDSFRQQRCEVMLNVERVYRETKSSETQNAANEFRNAMQCDQKALSALSALRLKDSALVNPTHGHFASLANLHGSCSEDSIPKYSKHGWFPLVSCKICKILSPDEPFLDDSIELSMFSSLVFKSPQVTKGTNYVSLLALLRSPYFRS